METNNTLPKVYTDMFITNQYGGVGNLNGDFWDAMLWYGHDVYYIVNSFRVDEVADVDMMLIGL